MDSEKLLPLIVMAHPGEAQAFLKVSNITRPFKNYPNFYQGPDYYLIITGEGMELAQSWVQLALAKLEGKINQVINLGIAAGLDQSTQIGNFYQIRTSYAFRSEGPVFKSFVGPNTIQQKGCIDCMSTSFRVLNEEIATKLSHFSPIVDRELWGIAFAANLAHVPWQSYKLVSDSGDNQEICTQVKEEAHIFSQKMFEYFMEQTPRSFPFKKEDQLHPLLEKNFYFTVAQKRLLKKYLDSLKKLGKDEGQVFAEIHLKELAYEPVRPKVRTAKLIQALEEYLDPTWSQIKKQIDSYIKKHQKNGVQLSMNRENEKHLDISFKIRAKTDLEATLNYLEQLPIEHWEQIVEGPSSVL